MKVKINKGDTVEVISGNDKGHRGEVQQVIRKKNKDGTYDPDRVYVIVTGANLVIQASAPDRPCRHADGPHREGSADPHQQCDAGGHGRQADARRLRSGGRRQQGTHRPQERRCAAQAEVKG